MVTSPAPNTVFFQKYSDLACAQAEENVQRNVNVDCDHPFGVGQWDTMQQQVNCLPRTIMSKTWPRIPDTRDSSKPSAQLDKLQGEVS